MYKKNLYTIQAPNIVELGNETVIQGSGNPRPKSVHLPTKPGKYKQVIVNNLLVLVHEDRELTPETRLRLHRKTVSADQTVSVNTTTNQTIASAQTLNETVHIWIHKRDKQVDVIILDSYGTVFDTTTINDDGDIYEVNYTIQPTRNGKINVYVEISQFLMSNPNEYEHYVYKSWFASVHWNYATKQLNQFIDEANKYMEHLERGDSD